MSFCLVSLVIALLIECIVLVSQASLVDYLPHLEPEIADSLNENIRLRCAWAIVNLERLYTENSVHSQKTLQSSVTYPDLNEFQEFQSLNSTLTRSNSILHILAAKRGYDESWAAKTKQRWQIPIDHPEQNRGQCFDALLKVSKNAQTSPPLQLYNNYRSNITRSTYIVKIRQAFVHPTGFVASVCG